MTSADYTPLEQPSQVATASRGFTIGVPACRHESERRFPLTPEGASRLIERGFRVKIAEAMVMSAKTSFHREKALLEVETADVFHTFLQ